MIWEQSVTSMFKAYLDTGRKLSAAYEAVAMKEIVVAAVMGAVLWTSGCEIHEDVLHMRYILFFSSKVGAIIK